MFCKNFYGRGTQSRVGDGSPWGDWMSVEYCPRNSFVCGVNARVEDPQGTLVDDKSVNELEFFCCSSKNFTW